MVTPVFWPLTERPCCAGELGGNDPWNRARRHGTEDDNESPQNKKERMWVIVKDKSTKLALGLVYMGVNMKTNRARNKGLWDKLQRKTEELQNMECKVMLVGDFNGHIGVEREDWQEWGKVNENGRSPLKLVKKQNLQIANKSPKCEGKWIWSRGDQRSVVDFALMDNWIMAHMEQMTIDETQETWTVGSHHCWIQIKLNSMVWEQREKEQKENMWWIAPRTDWTTYREKVEQRIQEW